AVAGEGELAAVAPIVVLIDDPADRVRIGGIADAVQDDLRDRRLSLHRFAARLEIDAGSEALLLTLGEDAWRKGHARPRMVVVHDRRNEPAVVLVLQDASEG